jgi:ATP-dependent RNA helicase DeaD
MLINFNEKKFVTRIGAHYNIHFEERPLPNDEDVENLVAQRLIGQLEARMRERDNLQIERMRRFEPLVRHLVETEDGLSLLTMLLDDTYHTWMHQPLDQAPIDEASPPKRKQGLNRPRTSGRRPIKTGNRRSR